jgi:hypothetical protein
MTKFRSITYILSGSSTVELLAVQYLKPNYFSYIVINWLTNSELTAANFITINVREEYSHKIIIIIAIIIINFHLN